MLLVKCRTGTRRHWAAFKTRSLKATDCSALDKSQPWTLLAGCWYGDFRKPKAYGKGDHTIICEAPSTCIGTGLVFYIPAGYLEKSIKAWEGRT